MATDVNAIISSIFDATDASTSISAFLSVDYQFNGPATHDGFVTNWTYLCSNPRDRFSSFPTFVGCLLYPNVTRHVLDGTLPTIQGGTNLTAVGFSSLDLASSLWSIYSTCLPTYCASVSDCAATDVCDVGNLLTSSYELSAQGVGKCYRLLCSVNVSTPNPDIAGIGILVSYLMQTLIALLGFFALATLAVLQSREAADSEDPNPTTPHQDEAEPKGHFAIVNAVVADFHRSQCYFAIALQIATFVIIRGGYASTTWTDENFLLLTSADGLIPVVLTFYTIMTFGTRSWYVIVLTVITVVFSSITGGLVSHRFLQSPDVFSYVNSGNWPAACGGEGPNALCQQQIGPGSASVVLLVAIAILDVITLLLVLWKIFTEVKWVTSRLPVRSKTSSVLSTNQTTRYNNAIVLFRRYPTNILVHSLVTLSLLAVVGMELYFFRVIFTDGLIDFNGWGFGQIVGITIWVSVFTDLGYLEFNGLTKGIAWRFPPWLEITTYSKYLNPRSETAPTHEHEPVAIKSNIADPDSHSATNIVKYAAVAKYDEAQP